MRLGFAVALLAATALTACTRNESSTASTATASTTATAAPAAATPTSAAAADTARADDAAGAEAFVRGVYAAYSDAPGGTGPDHAVTTYSAELNRLIAAGGPTGEPPNLGLDADPICDCQDWQALTLTQVAVTPRGAGRAEARVSFTNMASPTTQTLLLVRDPAGWRVDDVRTADRPSLTAQLRESAARPAA